HVEFVADGGGGRVAPGGDVGGLFDLELGCRLRGRLGRRGVGVLLLGRRDRHQSPESRPHRPERRTPSVHPRPPTRRGRRESVDYIPRAGENDMKTSYPSTSRYACSLNPTTSVLPTRAVGARRLPVGPSSRASSVSSSGRLSVRSNVSTFLPFAATSFST